LFLVRLQVRALVRCRSNRVIGLESASSLEFSDGYCLDASDHHSLSGQWLLSKFCWKGVFAKTHFLVVVSVFCGTDVQVAKRGLSFRELFSDSFGGEVEVIISKAQRGA